MTQINDDLVVENGIKSGHLWTGSDFKGIGINCPSLAIAFLQAKQVKKGCLLWVHTDDEVTNNLQSGESALALYKFPQ
jgi:hypothetical protein